MQSGTGRTPSLDKQLVTEHLLGVTEHLLRADGEWGHVPAVMSWQRGVTPGAGSPHETQALPGPTCCRGSATTQQPATGPEHMGTFLAGGRRWPRGHLRALTPRLKRPIHSFRCLFILNVITTRWCPQVNNSSHSVMFSTKFQCLKPGRSKWRFPTSFRNVTPYTDAAAGVTAAAGAARAAPSALSLATVPTAPRGWQPPCSTPSLSQLLWDLLFLPWLHGRVHGKASNQVQCRVSLDYNLTIISHWEYVCLLCRATTTHNHPPPLLWPRPGLATPGCLYGWWPWGNHGPGS